MRIVLLVAFTTVVKSTRTNDGLTLETSPERSDRNSPSKREFILERRRAKHFVKDDASGTRAKRLVFKNSSIWDNGVFYKFNTTEQTIRKAFKVAAKAWSDNTCIDFFEDGNARDKVVVYDGDVCVTHVGRQGGDQILCLTNDYQTGGSTAHEIGHVLGLVHTVKRYDRDQFITVVMQNLEAAYIDEFETVSWEDAEAYGMAYDYGSVMHFDQLIGSTNNQPTIIAKDRHHQKTMGSPLIAFSDLYIINKRYKCDEKCNISTSAMCMNGGFPHPRNCHICICPSGYGGALCDQRPPGCGRILVASRHTKTLTYRLGYGFGMREQFDFCNFVITAGEGSKIVVELKSISLGYDNPGCKIGGVEIKAQRDQRLTGYRFCSMNGTDGPILSNSNRLSVILYNRFTYMDVNLTYSYVG